MARPCNYVFRWEQEKAAPGDRHLYEFLTEEVCQKIFEYKLFTTSEKILHLHDDTEPSKHGGDTNARRHIEQELAESMVYENICHLTVVYVKDMKIWIGQNYYVVQHN